MWICPKCKREFRNTHQQHTCKLVEVDDFFKNRSPELRALYELLLKKVRGIGEFRTECVAPNVVFCKTSSSFFAVKVMKDHLVAEFFLEQLEDVPPVSKFLQTSKHRWAHCVPVGEAADINKQLLDWIKRSYKLIS